MQIIKLICAVLFLLMPPTACKSVDVNNRSVKITPAPVSHSAKQGGTKSAVASTKSKDGQSIINGQVGASKMVSTADVPQLRINIDINLCIGVDKWLDPKAARGSNPASISVVLRSKTPSTKQLPLPWLILPNDAVAAGESVKAVHSNEWRMDVGSYSVDIVVFDVDTAQSQSILTMDFDFTKSHEVTLDAVGVWLPTKVCSIEWKKDASQSSVVP